MGKPGRRMARRRRPLEPRCRESAWQKLSASSAGANRKPWNSSQPAASRKRALRLGLDALGDHLHAQRLCHLHDGTHDARRRCSSPGRPWMKLRSIFRRCDREALQVGQARIAGAEVVDRQPHARARASACRRCRASSASRTRIDSVSSSSSRAAPAGAPAAPRRRGRRNRGCWNCSAETLTATGSDQPRGDPGGGLAHGLLEHPVADGDDEAGVLGHRDEARRRDLAERRVAPADQRLGADDARRWSGRPAAGSAAGSGCSPAPGASRGRAACALRRSPSACCWWKRRLLLPAALALRIAPSAWRSSSSALCPCPGASAMPTLQVSVKASAVELPGLRPRRRARAAAATSAAGASAWCSTVANWSPPMRAGRSPLRRQRLSRAATSCSTRSPTSWPRLSLT